jgi:hypothetical protein
LGAVQRSVTPADPTLLAFNDLGADSRRRAAAVRPVTDPSIWAALSHAVIHLTTLNHTLAFGCRDLGHLQGNVPAMNFTRIFLVVIAALAISAPAANAQTREYEGTVVSVDRSSRTFRIHDSERGTIRVRVTSRTRFERVSFSTLRAGARNIETIVRRSNGRWVALEVERSGGGGNHGGRDDD